MEVPLQEVKQERVEDSGITNYHQTNYNLNSNRSHLTTIEQRILVSPTHHLSGGTATTTSTGKFSNNNNISILENTLTNNNIISSASGSSVSSKITSNNNSNTTRISSSETSSPIITTTLNGEQLANMAKSSGLSIVHVSLPQTVIQTPSVIQSASGPIQLPKGNVILVSSKPSSSVIQATAGNIQAVHLVKGAPHSDESNDGVDRPSGTSSSAERERRRRDILTRRPSYRKILNDLGASEIADKGDSSNTSESSQDPLDNSSGATTADANSATSLQTITMTNAGTAGGTIVQYAQSHDGQQFFVPVGGELQAYTIRPVSSSASSSPSVVVGGGHHPPEEVTRKREIRLLKNREAARECRRKKKEYIKCLENRVAVLENQNKALIDELKSLKELYCQQKTE